MNIVELYLLYKADFEDQEHWLRLCYAHADCNNTMRIVQKLFCLGDKPSDSNSMECGEDEK